MRGIWLLPGLLLCMATGADMPSKVKLENPKVKITEITYTPGVPRPRYIRQGDQVVVFLDDCKYQRTDSQTSEKTVRERKSGEVIWHDKGEDAPVLVNLGSKPYRTLVIELNQATQNIRHSSKPALPEFVCQHDNSVFARLILISCENTAKEWARA